MKNLSLFGGGLTLAVSILGVCIFSSLSSAASVDEAVAWAHEQGLTQYTNASSFKQYNVLRRDEAAKFYVEFAKSLGKTEYTVPATQCVHFTDMQKAYRARLKSLAIRKEKGKREIGDIQAI